MAKLTVNEFYDAYLYPITIDGVALDEVENIFFLYREKMKACNSIEEMRKCSKRFGFLTAGVNQDLDQIILETGFKRLKKYLEGKTTALQFSNFILPKVMLHGHFIAEKYCLPEYYAAFQYYIANVYTEEELMGVKENV